MKVGEWVRSHYNEHKITGFVTNVYFEEITVFVTMPPNYHEIKLKNHEVWMADTVLGPEDVLSLIDFSLDSRDKEWFEQLSEDFKLWKPVEELNGRIQIFETNTFA